MITRTDIINFLIDRYGYRKYLEIGVRNPEDNFLKINAPYKVGVDPEVSRPDLFIYPTTSDGFFEDAIGMVINAEGGHEQFDIIFIDGLHTEAQVDRDIANALKHLNPGGSIVVHDCNPIVREHQSDSYNGGVWNGTVWKSFAKLRINNPNLEMVCVDTDHGVGIIRAGSQTIFGFHEHEILDYDFLAANRHTLLNLISPEQFVEEFKL